jgi:hypothetical protein
LAIGSHLIRPFENLPDIGFELAVSSFCDGVALASRVESRAEPLEQSVNRLVGPHVGVPWVYERDLAHLSCGIVAKFDAGPHTNEGEAGDNSWESGAKALE